MQAKGRSDVDRSALTFSFYGMLLAGIVAWQAKGDPLVICFAAGVPMGVLSLWLVLSLISESANGRAKRRRRRSSRKAARTMPTTAAIPVSVATLKKPKNPLSDLEFPPPSSDFEALDEVAYREELSSIDDLQFLIFEDTDPGIPEDDEFSDFEATRKSRSADFTFND